MGILTKELIYKVIKDARPTFRNAEDIIAFTVHAAFMASSFHLHATGPPAFTSYAFNSSSLEEVTIKYWNHYEDFYGFIYFHPEQGSKKVDVKVAVMPGQLFVNACRVGDSELTRLQIKIDEYAFKKEGNHHYLKNFEKLLGYIEKELVNKFDGGPCDRLHQSRLPAGGSSGDVHSDLKRLRDGSDCDVDHPDLKRLRDGSDCDVDYPDLQRLSYGSDCDVHSDLKRLRDGSDCDVDHPDLKRFKT